MIQHWTLHLTHRISIVVTLLIKITALDCYIVVMFFYTYGIYFAILIIIHCILKRQKYTNKNLSNEKDAQIYYFYSKTILFLNSTVKN